MSAANLQGQFTQSIKKGNDLTIVGKMLDASDVPRANTPVKFKPETNPAPGATGVLTAIIVSINTNETGDINIILDVGIYLVQVGLNPRDQFRIQVPEGDGESNIKDLFYTPPGTVPAIGTGFRVRTGQFQLLNVDTGLWHTIRLVGADQME